jgi:hypothetical protein
MSSDERLVISSERRLNVPYRSLEKYVSSAVIGILFFVFFEDLFRMLMPTPGPVWLILKDLLISGLYMSLAARVLKNSTSAFLPRIAFPLVVYLFIGTLTYAFSIIVHQPNDLSFLVGVRADLFYVGLALVITVAARYPGFWRFLTLLLGAVAFFNIMIAFIQFFIPETLAGLNGFYGLNEDRITAHQTASFHDENINYLYGLFSDTGKLARNLFHIFIWLWLLHLICDIGRIEKIFIASLLIGFVLIVSAKRLPAILWITAMLLLPFMMSATAFFTKTPRKLNTQLSSVKKIGRVGLIIICLGVAATTVSVGYSEKARLYAGYISYAVTHQIEERFIGTNDQYFWQSEVELIRHVGILGQGAGTSTMGKRYLVSEEESALRGHLEVEHGPLKVWLELGLFGLLQHFVLWAGLFVIDFITVGQLRHKPRWFAASLFITFFHFTAAASFFVGHQYFGDSQGQVHFWLITGLQVILWQRSGVYRVTNRIARGGHTDYENRQPKV